MPKIDNPIDETTDQPPYPGLQIEDVKQTVRAPNIESAFAHDAVPIYPNPSDVIGTYTFTLTPNTPAIRVCEKQDPGVASRVILKVRPIPGATIGAIPVKVVISARAERISNAANDASQSMTYTLHGPYTPGANLLIPADDPLILFTRSEIWAAAVNSAGGNVELSIVVETYDIDIRDHVIEQYYPVEDQVINLAPTPA